MAKAKQTKKQAKPKMVKVTTTTVRQVPEEHLTDFLDMLPYPLQLKMDALSQGKGVWSDEEAKTTLKIGGRNAKTKK